MSHQALIKLRLQQGMPIQQGIPCRGQGSPDFAALHQARLKSITPAGSTTENKRKKLGSGGQMQRTCPIFCRCESIGPRMKEWNPFVPNTGIFHILDANIFKNELPGPLS